ncbi:SIR2 family protein [Methanolobus sp. WCC1]|uniref:SIR2 family protein n=1 Tax=unclassified Methanolobus TaxID=2629569 RepID=UPI0032532AA7
MNDGVRNRNEEKVVFFFGAGASISEGAVGTNDLLKESFKLHHDEGSHNYERVDMVKKYLKDIYHNNYDNSNIPTFEEVLGPIDIALQKQENISSYWDLNKLTVLRDNLIYCVCAVLYEKLKEGWTPDNHNEFIMRLFRHRNQWEKYSFISLNYDILLDNALTNLGEGNTPIDLDYGFRFRNQEKRHENKREDKDTWYIPREKKVFLFKLHGSLNWLYCQTCNSIKITPKEKGVMKIYTHSEHCDSPSCKGKSEQKPIIVPPTFTKAYDNPFLVSIWLQAEKILQNATRVYFIGYSMPEADIHIQYLLKKSLFRQNGNEPKIIVVNIDSRDGYTHRRYQRLFGDVEYLHMGFEDFVLQSENYLSRSRGETSMGQTLESGRAGNTFGHRMAELAAKLLGTSLLDTENDSNEAMLNGQRVLIKSAHIGTNRIGALHDVLDRVTSVIAVLEDRNSPLNDVHKYSIYRIDSNWYKLEMRPDYKRDNIGYLGGGKIRKHCDKIRELTCDF